MELIDPPDVHFLAAAVGWLELGNVVEAKAELGKLAPNLHDHPDVLEVHWLVHAADQNWPAALDIAKRLIQVEPDRSFGWLHQAYALRRVPEGGLQAAWDSLLPVAEHFPKEPTIAYNLSCYACQMGRLEDARTWLKRALRIGDKARIKSMATADSDLKALWPEIKEW